MIGTQIDQKAWSEWVDRNPLRRWRASQWPKVSIKQSAQLLGVSITLIQLWERGVHVPSPPNFEKLLRCVGTTCKDEWAVWYNERPTI